MRGIVMSVGTGQERRVRRVGVGIVELVPEPRLDRSLETLRANLRSRSVLLMLAVLLAAQAADIVTTARALAGNGYVEKNPFFAVLLSHSPLAAYTVKLLMVAWLALLAARLPARTPRARRPGLRRRAQRLSAGAESAAAVARVAAAAARSYRGEADPRPLRPPDVRDFVRSRPTPRRASRAAVASRRML